MDAVKTSDELNVLRKIRHEKEEQIKTLGFEVTDISNETHSLLTSLSQLQTKLSLNTSDPEKLEEYFFAKKLDNIEQSLSVSKLKQDILDLETSLKKEEEDVNILELFLEDVKSKKLVTDVQKENHKIETQKAINDVMAKLPKNVSEADEATFLNVISKIEFLNKRKK
ncbi:hypothetical protein ACFFRR_009995 [Megaselia abdita]